MRIYDIITKKKQGIALSLEEIKFAIDKYMENQVHDYQMSALAMAICINGMNDKETYYLTKAMLESGDTVDLSQFGTLSVDKHSTGGVGDKTTLIVAPIVASCGCKVAKMSGRGLGFTGGTIDKLESISGFKTTLSSEDFLTQVEKINIAVIGQSGNLAPADKRLYALRDVTATIDSIPLIASSIMSKKLASGANSIVLDVKCGSGAFMKTREDATLLATSMINIGKSFNRNIRALVTNMDVPLGYAIGNSLEVWEAIQILSGKGESNLRELCIQLASNMVSLAKNIDTESARELILDAIDSKKALSKMAEWINEQGGDNSVVYNPELLLNARHQKSFVAKCDGYISKIQAEVVGKASMLLGAGRIKLGDNIDHSAGIILNKSYGDYVTKGDTIATMYASNEALFEGCEKELANAFELSSKKPPFEKLIYATL